jgi:hypothetical protein
VVGVESRRTVALEGVLAHHAPSQVFDLARFAAKQTITAQPNVSFSSLTAFETARLWN